MGGVNTVRPSWRGAASAAALTVAVALLGPTAPPSAAAPRDVPAAATGSAQPGSTTAPTATEPDATPPPRVDNDPANIGAEPDATPRRLFAIAATPGTEPDATPWRLSGGDRIGTAAAIARHVYSGPVGAATAILARGDAFPDALAAAGLAGALDAPILLTHPDRLPPATASALDDLGVERVVLLGGHGAIAPAVEAEVARSRVVERLAGHDRYETAARIAEASAAPTGGNRPDTVIVVRGDSFADALAGGAPAFADGWPILLTRPDGLPQPAVAALAALRPRRALVLGGEAAVSRGVTDQLRGRGIAVERIFGPTRTGTATALADRLAVDAAWQVTTTILARGDDFADALAAAPLAGRVRAPILLAEGPRTLGPHATAWLARRCPSVRRVVAVGGAAAVEESTLDDAQHARLDCVPLPSPLDVRFQVIAADADATAALGRKAAEVLGDRRGWALGGDVRFRLVTGPADFTLRLATSPEVAAADPRCVGGRVCRVGDDLWLDLDPWRSPPAQWRGREAEYRTYLLNHVVGLWLGVPAGSCGAGAAPVMANQSDALGGCGPGPWPSDSERARARQRHVPTVTIAFGGDVHGEGRVRTLLLGGGNPLDRVASLLRDADLAMVNLETAVGTSGSPQPGKTYTFQAPPVLLDRLRAGGVDVVSLANNHALDYGQVALAETIQRARAAGLATVGAGRDLAEAQAPSVFRIKRRNVAVVGLSRVLSPGWAAAAGRPGIASAYDLAAAERAVRAAAAEADLVVVLIHWGVELAECPDGHQLELARRLTAAGAHVVAGHHPHILQGVQRLGSSLVHYSLGNFVWYHSRAPSRYTGVWTVELDGRGAVADRFTPADIDSAGRPVPVGGALGDQIRADVVRRSPGGGRCRF